MSVRFNSIPARLLLTASCVCVLTVGGFSASAQQLTVPFKLFAHSDVSSSSLASAGDSGYWIVSTHASPQSFDHACPDFRPCTLRHECGGGEVRRDFAEMCQLLTPGVPVCIHVHGSFVTWQDVIVQSHMTWNWLQTASCGQPVQLINFTWPSGGPISIPTLQLDVNILGRRAARNGYYLADLIRCIPADSPICLIGHSHGARVVAAGLHLMGGGAVQGVSHPAARSYGRRIRTVFAASAIRHDWLNPGKRYGRALSVTECLLNMKNGRDPALSLYPLTNPCAGLALGTTGFTHKDRWKLRDWSRRVADYKVCQTIGVAHLWPNYAARPELAMAIRNYVYFPDLAPPAAGRVTFEE